MSLKAKVEAIIYAAEEPVTLEQMAVLLRENVLAELAATRARAEAEAAESGENVAAGESAAALNETADGAEAAAWETSGDPERVFDPTAKMLTETVEAAEAAAETAVEVSEEAVVAEPAMPDEAQPAALAETQPAAPDEAEPAVGASVTAPETTARKRSKPARTEQEIAEDKAVKARLREVLAELAVDYSDEGRGMEVRQVAGGYRMATKPEHHDVVRAFAKSLKPPIRLSLAALETLAVIAYKQPVTGPEISDIRGIESAGVLGTLLERKLITTGGRKQVIGRPMQYKTSKEFLLRFGLNEINELPSMEEFSQLVSDGIELTAANEAEAAAEPSLFDGEGEDARADDAAPSGAVENDAVETEEARKEDVKEEASADEAAEITDASTLDEEVKDAADLEDAGDEGHRAE
jgi:segregation and condensation protein B